MRYNQTWYDIVERLRPTQDESWLMVRHAYEASNYTDIVRGLVLAYTCSEPFQLGAAHQRKTHAEIAEALRSVADECDGMVERATPRTEGVSA